MACLSACDVNSDNNSGGKSQGSDFETGSPGRDGPESPTGHNTPAEPSKPAVEYTHDDTSIVYHGPEGDFVINADHSIQVSLPDGTSCSADTTGKLASTSGERGMGCEVKVHTFYDSQVEMIIQDADGKTVWKLESTWACTSKDRACPPAIHAYTPNGGSTAFPK
ncbi:MAG: hypothetical protein FWF02_11585 [Micrococcales bacterium]|nr:hypothetical protein [Micrococcales bacterium]